MMLKKERAVIFLLESHLDKTKQWLNNASESLVSYLAGDVEKMKHLLLAKDDVHRSLENERREIWDLLCSGAYFPVIRGDLLELVQSVGRIGQAATAACEAVQYRLPQTPTDITNRLSGITREVFSLFHPIHESALYYLRGDDVLKVVRRNVIHFLDQKARVLAEADELKRRLHAAAMDNWRQLGCIICLDSLLAICSRAMEANDKIQVVMVKIVP